jgi:nucleoside-diphosphate-sugar epimerase
MARCIVTGHKGYIGSKLFSRLTELGHEVLGLDLNDDISTNVIKTLSESTDGAFHPHYENFQPEYIFHMACWPRIGLCLEDPVGTMRNNVLAGSVVLNFARKVKSVKRVIYSSSSSVMGNGNGPTNPYALQKLVTEKECGVYSDVYGLDTVSLRYFNVYSEDQRADGPYATAIANWRRALQAGEQPFITGDGEQRRDMVHVDDVVSANIHCMEHAERFDGKVFDVGTGDNISLNEVSEIVQAYHDVEFSYVPPRPGEVAATRADTTSLEDHGWTASVAIPEGIHRCFDFTKEQDES